ncbi:alpha/beta fold hydrolase [Sphingomonas mucosissima]|uniref:2-hydroxy-6-oxononadienedioate/2-hydroxy-6-oxononatrienedioate hydrolase n=1 Tax=Sphingomonas mucosissima TaxID=370959 RepID=A0A245ZM00_9SPHN|nr:alpha/beta hydrolase [Sphingomonas mucosissima]OWK30771.1 2-hydroxy-6-oxononadienedioate/2-hydroxy-6-oxononatrienedioate hydrolase [Sphingomonas mucosissima]
MARPLARRLLPVPLLLLTAITAVWLAAILRERGAVMPPEERRIATPLGTVAADIRGPAHGTPVLIVPGTAGWSGLWREVSAHLAGRGYRVIAIDLPPFGFSEHDREARYGRVSQAKRLAAVLDAAAHGPAIVIAHSFGAGAAAELALRRPDLVGRFVMVDGALGALDPVGSSRIRALDTMGLAQPLVAATLTNPHALAPLVRTMVAREDAADRWRETLRLPMRRRETTAAYAAWLPHLFAVDAAERSRYSADLRTMRPPVRLIWGEADSVTPIDQGERLSALFGAPLIRLPGLGHIPHIEDRDAFLTALTEALS